jgi:hypothetical protein
MQHSADVVRSRSGVGDEAPLAVLLFCSELSAIDLPFPAEILDRPRFDDQRTARRWLFRHCFSLFSGR